MTIHVLSKLLFYKPLEEDKVTNKRKSGSIDGGWYIETAIPLAFFEKKLEDLEKANLGVCFIDGEFTMKRIRIEKDCCWLVPANKKYQPIMVTEDNDFLIWGIVVHVIKSF